MTAKTSGNVMGGVLMVVGFGWALLGASNIFGMPWGEGESEGILMFGLIFNMIIFVLPGLGVGALGKKLWG
jgi:hypothetical protein